MVSSGVNSVEQGSEAQALALLAAGAVHELNNPLSVLVGYLSLILSGKTPVEQLTAQLQMMQTEVKYCRKVLDGLAELASAATGQHAELDLFELAREATGAFAETSPLSISVTGSSTRMIGQRQALSSLLSHALRNAAEAEATRILVEVRSIPGGASLLITDDGRGLSPDSTVRAKQPFYTTKNAQLGLGLTLCNVVAQEHHGTLSVVSAAAEGTTFLLTLPIRSLHPGESS